MIAAPEPKAELQLPLTGERRVVIRDVSWEGYLQILGALPHSRSSPLTYDDGVLEITMPLEDHEFYRSLIEYFIRTLVELCGLRIKTMGSTTMNYPSLKKGAEPDNAYYSPTFPQVPKDWLYQFLEQAKEDEIDAVQSLRAQFQQFL
jgi:Uma2 family endonuclease